MRYVSEQLWYSGTGTGAGTDTGTDTGNFVLQDNFNRHGTSCPGNDE